MKEKLMNVGILVTFYLTIVIGVLLLNQKCKYLNNEGIKNSDNSYIGVYK